MKLFRHFFVLCLIVLATAPAKAQLETVIRGSNSLVFGIGLPNTTTWFFKLATGGEPGYSFQGAGPFHVKYERGLSARFTLGLSVNAAFSSMKHVYTEETQDGDGFTNKHTYEESIRGPQIAANVRFNYYFLNTGRVQLYSGVGMGYHYSGLEYKTNDPSDDGFTGESLTSLQNLFPIAYEGTLGAKVMFNKACGAYLEMGYAKSLIQGGILFKWGEDPRW